MVSHLQAAWLSSEAYLAAEMQSDRKHEYIDGYVFAMTGASDTHVTLTLNMAIALIDRLEGSGCDVYASDMKLRVKKRNCFYYPDLLVTCDRRDRTASHVKEHPKLIVEVLSPSTEAFDRGDKFANYRTLASLEEYALVSQTKMRVECFRRNAEEIWVFQSFEVGDEVRLESVGLRCAIEDLYRRVRLPEAAKGDRAPEN